MRPGQCPCGWLLSWWLVYLGDFWDIYSKALNVNSQNMKLGICGTYLWRLFVQIINDRITLMLRGSNRPKAGLNFLRHPTQHRQQQQPRAVHRRPLLEHIIFMGFWQMSPLQFGQLLLSKRILNCPIESSPPTHGFAWHQSPKTTRPSAARWTIEAQQGQHGQWQSPLVSSIASPWKWKSQSWVKLIILVTSSN